MLNRVTYSHALRAPKPWPSSPLAVTAAAISTPTTLSTKTISSVVLNADLVSVVLKSGLASAVRRGSSAPALYVGAFVVASVVVIGGTSNLARDAVDNQAPPAAGANRFASPAGTPVCSGALRL